MFGPASMPAGWPGMTSSTICDMRSVVPCSRPLTRETIGTQGRKLARRSVSTCRKLCDGTAITMTSAESAAMSKSLVAFRFGESWTSSPRYRRLRWRSLMSSAVSGERTHCIVSERRAAMDATVVPQEPPPSTTTRGSRRGGVMGVTLGGSPAGSPVVDELQRHLEVGLLEHRDDGLQVIPLL